MSTSSPTVRALRGATTVASNTAEAIARGTEELLAALLEVNGVVPEDVISVVFTTTADLDAAFPAAAAHGMGLGRVPLLCTREIDVPGALGSCIRVLMHLHTTKEASELEHVYLRDAVGLRGATGED